MILAAQGFLPQAAVYLAAAVLVVPIARRLGLGSVLGYLIAGVAIGPFGLGLVGDTESGEMLHVAEFGVVMMLFLIGLELQPRLLWRMRTPILGLGGLQVVATTALLGALAMAAGLSWQAALAVGMTLSLSSTAIVLQSLAEKGMSNSAAGRSAFAVLLFQDIAVIPMLALLPLLASESTASTTGDGQHPLVVLGTVAAVVVAGRYLSRPVFRFLAASELREIFTAAALLLVVGVSLAMLAVGLSPALGAFVAGVVLAENEYRHELEADIEPFKGLLLGLFFLSVGAGIDFGLLAERPATIAAMVAGLVITKLAVLAVLGRAFRMPAGAGLLFTFALAQGGEFAFVLFEFARQNGVLAADTTGPLVAAVALSMLATPLLLILEERWIRPRLRSAASSAPTEAPAGPDGHARRVILAGHGRYGHIVSRLLKAQRLEPTVLELDPTQITLLSRFGLQSFYGDASRADLLEAAGARDAELLIVAVDAPDAALAIVREARRSFPHLRILARARGRASAYDLLDAGAEEVFRETLESSLALGARALTALGRHPHESHRAAQTFGRHDRRNFHELHAHRHDQAKYVSEARARIQALEQVLEADRSDESPAVDGAWDPPGPPAPQPPA